MSTLLSLLFVPAVAIGIGIVGYFVLGRIEPVSPDGKPKPSAMSD